MCLLSWFFSVDRSLKRRQVKPLAASLLDALDYDSSDDSDFEVGDSSGKQKKLIPLGEKKKRRRVATYIINPDAMNKTLKCGTQWGESSAYVAVVVPPDRGVCSRYQH